MGDGKFRDSILLTIAAIIACWVIWANKDWRRQNMPNSAPATQAQPQ